MGNSSGLRRVGALVAASSVVIGLLAVAPTALAVGASQSATALGQWGVSPVPVGMTSQITASVTAGATGDVVFSLDSVVVATVSLDVNDHAIYTLPADTTAGVHTLRAQYQGDATYAVSEDSTSIFVGPRAVLVTVDVSGVPTGGGVQDELGDVVTATVTVADFGTTGSVPVSGGHVDIKVDGAIKASFDLPTTQANLNTTTWGLGDHQVRAYYTAGAIADHADGSSANATVTLVANSVNVTTGIQYSVFYPYHDGYRDTDAIKGVRNESAKVTIRIYNSAAKLVRSQPIAMGTGAWSFAWNGKTAAGTALPAGKYTVKQIVTDSKNLSATFVSYITISAKRLHTYSKTITKDYAHREAQGTYTVSWAFSLPSATFYKKLVFGAYGKSASGGALGPQDFSLCSRGTLSTACVSRVAAIGSTTRWYSVTGSVTLDRTGTFVRLYAASSTRTWLKQGRVTVTYQVLK